MSNDLSQFLDAFFEESLELLDEMENGLMDLSIEAIDDDVINSIFRAAHSIKGGAATFNLTAISEFTHSVETFLDQVRSQQATLYEQHMNALFESVDLVREIIQNTQNQLPLNNEKIENLKKQFDSFCESAGNSSEDKSLTGESKDKKSITLDNVNENDPDELEALFDNLVSGDLDVATVGVCYEWHILFVPSESVFSENCQPSSTLEELSELAHVKEVTANLSNLPDLEHFDPSKCYMSWKIILEESVSKEDIEQIFWWYSEETKVVIKQEKLESNSENIILPKIENNIPADNIVVSKANEVAENVVKSLQNNPEKKPTQSTAVQQTASIRVNIDKVDSLINMVGELVITQAMLGQVVKEMHADETIRLREGLAQLEQNSRELQESVMRIRMLPVSNVFNRFPRLVRDIEKKVKKQIKLNVIGENTEIDKTVLEKINDPLLHLIRNCADHGIEPESERLEKGKTPYGTIDLKAYHQGGNVMIEISDDGRGLDRNKLLNKGIEKGLIDPNANLSDDEVFECLFMPGFSTAEQVTDLSGRGVGMDVVKKNINSLGGDVLIQSKLNQGTKFIIRLPLTLAILDGQTVRVGDQIYIIPLIAMHETIKIKSDSICHVGKLSEVYNLRDQFIPVIKLWNVLPTNRDEAKENEKGGFLIIIETHHRRYALMIDDILSHQQVVIKSLENNYQKILGISGATILGDGRVALIIDVNEIVQLANIGQVA